MITMDEKKRRIMKLRHKNAIGAAGAYMVLFEGWKISDFDKRTQNAIRRAFATINNKDYLPKDELVSCWFCYGTGQDDREEVCPFCDGAGKIKKEDHWYYWE